MLLMVELGRDFRGDVKLYVEQAFALAVRQQPYANPSRSIACLEVDDRRYSRRERRCES
jgi:hypothetical protein